MARSEQSLAAFAAEAENWLATAVPAQWRDNRGKLTGEESDALRREWDRILWEGGYSGLSIPREHGGGGFGLAEEVVFHVLAGKVQAPDGLTRVGKTLVAPLLIKSGSPAQREKYLPPMMRGDEVWCQGFSEPGAGSDLANIQTRARRAEGGYLLTGQKVWTSFAQHAQRCLVLAQTRPDEGRYRNLSMFLVDMSQPGITISDIKQISGAVHFAEVRFDDVFVADEDRVGDDGEGWQIAMRVLADERGGVESATRYVEIRSDLDLLLATVGDRPELAGALRDLDVRAELLRWQLAKVVDREEDADAAFQRSASVLKVMWSELWQDVTRLGLDTAPHEHREHWRYQYLEARAVSIYSGTNEIQRNILSERILGLPR
ncbi:acyl-CoA dehydrogenase family protein [Amycolatopsis echigonensis]|uniref:Acyl-CoA dehydrogenase family protein n=2 Tax=Amycolatopsis echigonensis TaxID=2576905 RepID=A0A8E1W1D9_9PSEU|nr:acyl-CoA dehydrogenase family protein [Amycolatopsis echigonensis]